MTSRGSIVRALLPFALAAALAACGNGSPKYSGDAPTPDQAYGQCAFCHLDVAGPMTAAHGHGGLDVKCESCHADQEPGYAECGHRAIPSCLSCHAQVTHHDPAVATLRQCTICHDPHGSPNLLLVRAELPLSNPDNQVEACSEGDAEACTRGSICAGSSVSCGVPTATGGCAAPIRFDNLKGRADGSFASATRPGTGLCEVCHTTTAYYRADGKGAPHYTEACYSCHTHERGFVARGGGNATMQPGSNCLSCHVQGGSAGDVPFTAAGTVFGSPTATPDQGVDGVDVILSDSTGKTVSLVTNSVGNFYTQEPLSFPIRARLRRGASEQVMPIPISNGGCASCHAIPPAGGAPGRLWIAP